MSGKGSLEFDNNTIALDYQTRWEWNPSPRLKVTANLNTRDAFWIWGAGRNNKPLVFTDADGDRFNAVIYSSQNGALELSFNQPNIKGESAKAKKLVYLIANAPQHFVDRNIEVEHQDWLLTITPTSIGIDTKAQQAGLIGPTNILEIEIKSNYWPSIDSVIKFLYGGLSFLFGMPASVTGPFAFDENGQLIQSRLNNPMYYGRKLTYNWVDDTHVAGCLNILSFMGDGLLDKNFSPPLFLPIGWYAYHNMQAVDVESAIVIGCAALDSIAWDYLIERMHLLSPNAFKKLSASDRTTLMMRSLSIPTNIHSHHKSLAAFALASNHPDCSTAIHGIRNAIVHPDHKAAFHRKSGNQLLFINALQQIMWMIEMSVLAICKYEGPYVDRREEFWMRKQFPTDLSK